MRVCDRKRIGWVLLSASVLVPASVHAQAPCVLADTAVAPWEGPLTRRVTLYAADITIGEALDRLAAAAGIRFSYSADAVPLERRVCASYASLAVGSALTQLLRG